MVMNISWKFEKSSYDRFFVRAVTVKYLYTLHQRRKHNEAKSIVSTGWAPPSRSNSVANAKPKYTLNKM